MKRPALLIIDMIVDFFYPAYGQGTLATMRVDLVTPINRLAGFFRRHGLSVIWVRQEFKPDLSDAPLLMRKKKIMMNIMGTDGCRLLPELDVDSADEQIVKKRFSAFFGTGLEQLFQRLNADTVIICGVKTSACVRMSAIDAYQHDLHVIIPRDCVADDDGQAHVATLQLLERGIAAVRDVKWVIDHVTATPPPIGTKR